MESLQTKYTLLSLLFKLSMSDMDVSRKELSYVYKVGIKLGLNIQEIMAVMDRPEKFPIQYPRERHDRLKIIYHLVVLMQLDNKSSKDELLLINEACSKLGLNQAESTTVINEMRACISKEMSEKETVLKLNQLF